MPRFVVLYHELPPESGRPSHWDFMLENGTVLRTWAMNTPWGSPTGQAQGLPDHRLMYLEYEGPVSENRGKVSRMEWGTYEVEREDEEGIRVVLKGHRKSGRLELMVVNQAENQWQFQYEPNLPQADIKSNL